VGVSDGRIVSIGRLKGNRVSRTIDASGRVVAPGFIDMHSDVTLLDHPGGESNVH